MSTKTLSAKTVSAKAVSAQQVPAGVVPHRVGSRVRGPVRLTRRGRVVVVVAALFVLLAAGFSLGRATSAADAAGPPRTVVVAPGDTLWALAARHVPRADPRVTVAKIRSLNHLTSVTVQAGQRLRVPAGQ